MTIVRFNGSTPDQFQGITCTPVYSKSTAALTVDASTSNIIGSPRIMSTQQNVSLPNGDELLHWISSSHSSVGTCDNIQANYDISDWDWPWPLLGGTGTDLIYTGWLDIIVRTRNLTLVDITDMDRFISHSKAAFHDIFPYLALEAYTKSIDEELTGEYAYVGDRLVSKDSSVRILQASLIILVAIVALLFVLRPVTHLRNDPGSLSSATSVLASSSDVQACLAGTGSMNLKELSKHLDGAAFHTSHNKDGDLTIISTGLALATVNFFSHSCTELIF